MEVVEVNDRERVAGRSSDMGEVWTVVDGADEAGRELVDGGSEIGDKQLGGGGHGRNYEGTRSAEGNLMKRGNQMRLCELFCYKSHLLIATALYKAYLKKKKNRC